MHERKIGDHTLHPESLMMGYGYEPRLSEGAIKPPVFLTSTFVFESAEAGKAFFELAYGLREPSPGEEPGLIYSRLNNPGLQIVEERLGLWDGAEDAALFASGMAALSTALLAVVRPGDVVILRAPAHVDHPFRRMSITQIGPCRSLGSAHVDHLFRRMSITRIGHVDHLMSTGS